MRFNEKGLSLPEILLSLMIIAMTSLLLSDQLISSSRYFASYANYTRQQERINDALQRLRGEIEAATEVTIIGTAPYIDGVSLQVPGKGGREWRFDANQLKCTSGGTSHVMVDRLLTPQSKLMYLSSLDTLVILVQPVQDATALNIITPTTMEYSLRYKVVN